MKVERRKESVKSVLFSKENNCISEMVFARNAHSKKTYLDWHVEIRPLKGIPFNKNKSFHA